MNEFYIRNVIEAALLAAGKPLQLAEIGQLFDESSRPKAEDLRAGLDALAAEYSSRGVEVKETAAGFRIQVRREFSAEISRLWPERPARYSRALLETLALIAYRQPITRAEIEAVRGVAVNPNIIKTVIERNWVRVVGHRDVPGRPELLGTTREFLDYFGLRSLDELPPLAEIKAMGDYNLQLDLPSAALADGEAGKPDALEGEAPVASAVSGVGEDDEGAPNAIADDAPDAGAETVIGDEPDHVTSAEANGSGEVAHVTDEHAKAAADTTTHAPNDQAQVAMGAAHGTGGETNIVGGAARDSDGLDDSDTDSLETSRAHHDSDAEVEADRTLTSAPHAAKRTASEAEDADASDSATPNESSDALDDSADDDSEDDELSADGHGSRELVAAPRDLDD